MYLERPNKLDTTIEVTASNRPVKIAYIVPSDASPRTHMVVDAAFYESYTRWAGAFSLFLPMTGAAFLSTDYLHWLTFFDPDFVYSYVDLTADVVGEIDRLCCPIAFLKHKLAPQGDRNALR